MRLFTGIDLPPELVTNLEKLLAHLQPTAAISWSPPRNLHITTKFIGEWPESRLEELKTALQKIPRSGPIPMRVEGLGWFPNPHSPQVFWAGVNGALAPLARETDAAAAALGVPAETRDFHPHLTLARIKTPVDLAPLRHAVAQLGSVEFGAFEAASQFLYSSKDSVYTKLAEFPL